MEFALKAREVEAAFGAISNVVDAVPSEAVPELTEMVSVLTVAVLPAKSFGVMINRLPLFTN